MPSDKLIIETPEQVHLEFVLADVGSRFMAMVADTLIQIVLILALIILDETLGKGLMFSRLGGYNAWMVALVIFLYYCIYWGYFAVFEAVWNGQTPGKRWAGIRVIKQSGRPINAWEAIARNLMRVIDGQPGILYAVGVVTMLVNSKSRRLGDFVGGTLVVHDKKGQEADLFFTAEKKSEYGMQQAALLAVPELELIETFLARRAELPESVRTENARRIAQMICSRLGMDARSCYADPENFLEGIVREFRSHAQYR